MANVRDSDTSLWLHNKLGTSNDSWTGGSICSQLTAEVLQNIKDCFPDLQTQVKLKLLLSFFHIPKRNIEEWKNQLEEILEVAQFDSELWVSMLAEALKTYPMSGQLNSEIQDQDETRPIFYDLVNDLRKLVKRLHNTQDIFSSLLPLECLYLNKAALISVVGEQPCPERHFNIKKKPKSAYIRADLLQKASDMASNIKKQSAPVIPVRSRGMPRKMTDTTPLKGIPSRVPSLGFRLGPSGASGQQRAPPQLSRTSAGRKDGGIKLLDITEQPSQQQAKKRKRLIGDLDVDNKKLQENQSMNNQQQLLSPGSVPPPTPGPPPTPQQTTLATPDYAAGLTTQVPSSNILENTNQDFSTTPTQTQSNDSMLITNNNNQFNNEQQEQQQQQLNNQQLVNNNQLETNQQLLSEAKTIAVIKPVMPQQPPQQPTLIRTISTNNQPQQFIVAQPIQQNTGLQQIGIQQIVTQLVSGQPTTAIVQQVQQQPQQQTNQVQQQRVTQVRLQPPPQAAANPLQRKGLSLTREQMIVAQDMFRTANKVTRPEKALILGFMAGSRENPCPHLGNIVTIKLSENQENVQQLDSTIVQMTVETHFQMNYNTGEWKRIKKYRKMDSQSQPNQNMQQTLIVHTQPTQSAQFQS